MAYQPTEWEHGDIITGGKLNKIEQELTHVADNATYGFGGAQLSSDGLTPFSYINAGDPMPANPQKGDTVFLKDGNDFLIYSYNGEDWVLKIDPDLSNRIEETIKTASDNTDKAIADNNTQINETINQVAKSQADLAIKDGNFNNKAQAMADEALANAKANTATVAQETLNTANENLDAAKQSLTTDLQKEVSDRTTAVATLDSKAQGYADSAKQDAIAAATTADGTINKKIDETASSITSTVSQNKMDAEGKITTAQSTATQALTGLSSKVDTSTYNAKTGQLSTDVTNVTQTANQAKTDIASIKQTDTTQDARMTTIEADADGTKTTVSNLQKTQNTQSGSISTLQQRADGFDATVTKVNNLSVGARNYVQNSSGLNGSPTVRPTLIGATSGSNVTVTYPSDGILMTNGATNTTTEWYYQVANAWANFSETTLTPGKQITFSADVMGTVPQAVLRYGFNGGNGKESFKSFDINNTSWTRISITVTSTSTNTGLYFRIQGGINNQYANGWSGGETLKFRYVKIEDGNIPTDWTPAPEDTDNKFSAQQVTIDGITNTVSSQGSSINSLTTRVQTAEGTLSTATNNITGLQSKQTQTANQITQEISDRTNGDSNTLQSSKDFTTSSVSSAVNGVNSTITQTSDSLIAKINTKTDSDTVLSILKDNWSIGITDNISKITSGIVGNASQMSIISKNVTIDSPNTQIKGTAWIQSAMIANGAIGSAQIGDATITSAKIATLDVAKLTGNVSNFIQSNWNGLYQSVKISPIGMTISTSQGSTAQFNQDGLVLDGALGTTNVLNGQIELISSSNEYLGTFQHETMPEHDNVDYLMIKLAGWHTSKPGDSDYDLNSDSSNTIRGGDGIGFGVTNSVGTYDMKMSWDSSLVAGYKGRKAGWHVEDIMTWHQPTYFEGGFDVAQQFSSTDRRALHIQGATLSNGHKWFGFFDTPSQAGFGTDDTNDVLFYVKGKSYSLYTMLNKLSML